MSVVRLANGAIVMAGNHSGSRGSIANLQGDSQFTEEDSELDSQILKVASGAECEYADEHDIVMIECLFGIYKRQSPSFDSKYFIPGY